jgi:hypothetical protein
MLAGKRLGCTFVRVGTVSSGTVMSFRPNQHTRGCGGPEEASPAILERLHIYTCIIAVLLSVVSAWGERLVGRGAGRSRQPAACQCKQRYSWCAPTVIPAGKSTEI